MIPSVNPDIELINSPVPMPSVVLLFAIVGFVLVLQHTPRAVTVAAQSPVTFPPEVRFYIDDIGVISSTSFPYTYTWNTLNETIGSHIIKVIAKDNDGGF